MTSTPSLQAAFAAFDEANNQDPNAESINGQTIAKELLYAQRMTDHLNQFAPGSSDALQLAARSQHIQRWKSPRSDYPEGRQGYRDWRTELGKFHASTAGDLMSKVGYDKETIERVQLLLQKKGIKRDEEVQTLEDVICLVFLEFHLEDFAHKHDEDKLIDIIQKTWRKMSEKGHEAALQLPLNNELLGLVQKALQ